MAAGSSAVRADASWLERQFKIREAGSTVGAEIRGGLTTFLVMSYILVVNAVILSAALAGLAGSTKALVFQFASLTDVDWTMSGEVVLMALVGGIGTIFGPVVGAFLLVAMETYLAQIGSWVTTIEGAIFILCVLAFRQGIVGVLIARFPAIAGISRKIPEPAE